MTSNNRIWAVVPASGIGQRMRSDKPKQYLSFCGKTILEHTLDRLLACDHIHGAVLILSKDDQCWRELNYISRKPLVTTEGGAERQDSVINGLLKIQQLDKDDPLAMVHDAVRPLVSLQDLSALINAFDQGNQGAILASPLTDTIKRDSNEGSIAETIDRKGLWRALTPQLFDSNLLLKALQQARAKQQQMTDDSAAMEALGYRPLLVEGSSENIKITRPDDLKLAELIWLNQKN